MKMTHITIGIPAYNEGKNIDRLLKSLERQYMWGMILDEIIIVSDGSTDNTIEKIQSVKNKKIKYVHHANRRGINATMNELFSLSKSSILVLLNADVEIANRAFIHELVHPFRINSTIGIIGANVLPLKPKTLIEKTLSISHLLKKQIYDNLNQGNNIYNCHGRGRALSKRVYTHLRIPENTPEDSYAYLFCISNGSTFFYQKDAIVRFRSPQNFSDHVKQSVRFSQGKASLLEHFDSQKIEEEYIIPREILVRRIVPYLIKYPFYVALYLTMQMLIAIGFKHTLVSQSLFEPSYSSKGLV